jgi:hypothetical protein
MVEEIRGCTNDLRNYSAKAKAFAIREGDFMMDIERLKKLNTLAGELKGQGIAGNYEDAAYLATAIHGKEPEACLAGMSMDDQSTMAQQIMEEHPMPAQSVLEEPAQSVLEEPAQSVLEEPAMGQPVSQGLSKDEVEGILQAFANQVSKEFTVLQQKVTSAEAQISNLTATVQQLRQQPAGQQTLPVSEAAPQQESNAASDSTPSSTNSSQSANGSMSAQGTDSHSVKPEIKDEYSSNDVSVEKMFYFGNKK